MNVSVHLVEASAIMMSIATLFIVVFMILSDRLLIAFVALVIGFLSALSLAHLVKEITIINQKTQLETYFKQTKNDAIIEANVYNKLSDEAIIKIAEENYFKLKEVKENSTVIDRGTYIFERKNKL